MGTVSVGLAMVSAKIIRVREVTAARTAATLLTSTSTGCIPHRGSQRVSSDQVPP
jgi:hypothetical protein